MVYGGGLSSPLGPRQSSARVGACTDASGVLCPPHVRCVCACVENLAGGLGMHATPLWCAAGGYRCASMRCELNARRVLVRACVVTRGVMCVCVCVCALRRVRLAQLE